MKSDKMKRSEALLRNTVIYTIGSFGSKLISLFLVPVYSFFLTKAEIGYYDLVLTGLSLTIPLITIQISDSAYRWLLEAKGEITEQRKAISNSFSVVFINTLIAIIMLYIVLQVYPTKHSTYLSIILLLQSYYVWLQQLVRGLGNNKLFAISGIAYALMLLLFNVLFLLILKYTLDGVLISIILTNIFSIIALIYFGNILKFISAKTVKWHDTLTMIRYSLPLIPNTLSWLFISEINRFIILYNIGIEANGIYAMANKFPAIMLVISSIFILAWQDHAIKSDQDKQQTDSNSQIFNGLMILQLTMSILLTSISKYLMEYVVGSAFYSAWNYMPFLYLGIAFSTFSGFLGVGYLKSKKTGGIFVTTIIGGITNIIVSYFLSKKIGLYGPAIGTMCGFFIVWLVRLNKTKSFFRINVNYKSLAILLTINALYIYFVRLNIISLDIVLIFISIALFATYNKDLIIFLQKKVISFSVKNNKKYSLTTD